MSGPRLAPELCEMLRELGIKSETSILSESQTKVLELAKNGKSVLVLGSAGCGKSTVIKEIQTELANKQVQTTATTGIAAYNILGITLHSFMGFGTGQGSIQTLVGRIYKRKGVMNQIRNTDTLIIDEISMLSAELFEKIDTVLKIVRNSSLPFGGIQVIMSGDFMQLKPVIKEQDADKRLLFESETFLNYFKDTTVILTTNFRQQNDLTYQKLLTNVRNNKCTSNDLEVLKGCVSKIPPNDVPFLVSTNMMASSINKKNLDKIKGKSVTFVAKFDKEDTQVEDERQLSELYMKDLETQFKQRGLDILSLKVHARVMLIRNLDVPLGLVNGSLGVVTGINNSSVTVKFDCGTTKTVNKEKWEVGSKNTIVTVCQIPLILAYSITIHKSQSLTLSQARMDLSRCFDDHMVYVALSRVKSLDGLYIESFDPKKITVDSKTVVFLKSLISIEENGVKTIEILSKQRIRARPI